MRPLLVLRTPSEIIAGVFFAFTLNDLSQAILRSFGLLTSVVATVRWEVDLGVHVAGAAGAAAIYAWIRRHNDRLEAACPSTTPPSPT